MKKIIMLFLIAVTAQATIILDSPEYFAQFFYVKESIGNDPDFPQYQYRFVTTQYDDKIQMVDGRYLNPSVSLFLNENHTFSVTYKENYFQNLNDTFFMPGPCRKIEGTWNIQEGRLVLDGFGSAVKDFVDNKNALEITYEKNIISANLQGHKVKAAFAYANYGIEDALMMCF